MCLQFSVRLLQILSFVCNNTQPAVQLRDACYGCFLRTVSLPAGPPQMFGLSQCANLYLLSSTYQVCAQGLTVFQKLFKISNQRTPFLAFIIERFNLISKGFTCWHQTRQPHRSVEMCNWVLWIRSLYPTNKCIESGNYWQCLNDGGIWMIYVNYSTDQRLLHSQSGESRFQQSCRSSPFLHKHNGVHFG